MPASWLDTLDIARRLKGAGFSDAQAETVTQILRDVRSADLENLATKPDIERLEAATSADITRFEAATNASIGRLEVNIARLDAKLDSQLELLRKDLTIRLGSMIIAAPAILLAAKFFG